jgi:hypothetical protein
LATPSLTASFAAATFGTTAVGRSTLGALALLASLAAVARLFDALVLFRILLLFQEVSDVQEGVSLQAQIDECRLHAGKYARYFSLIDGAGERVLILAFVVDLGKLIVLDDRQPRFMRRA